MTTGANGSFKVVVPVGSATITYSAFGYLTATATVTVVADQVAPAGVALVSAPHHRLSGTVTDGDGAPVAAVAVSVKGTPIPAASTDANGAYAFASVPDAIWKRTVEECGRQLPSSARRACGGRMRWASRACTRPR